jgi:hypothetical protein
VAYLPVGKHKKDGSTICWDVTKFTQDKEFKQKESAYSDYPEQTVDGLSKQKISNGNIYVAVKLNHTATNKNIVVVTTQLESEKTLGGEIMRMHQMKELMKKMNEWKKNGLNIIFTSDLNAIPEQNTREISREAEKIVLEEFNLQGKWYCQETVPNTTVEDGKTYKAEFKDMSFIKADGSPIPITSKPYKFTMSIDKTDYELYKTCSMENWRSTDGKKRINCEEVTAINATTVPTTVTADDFDIRLQNLCGKTFYDSFSQKYVIDQYDSATPKKTTMTINGTDKWTIEKDENTVDYIAKPTNADTKVSCYLNGQEYEWACIEDVTPRKSFDMIWSHKLNTYQMNYPDGVYNYITNDATAETKVLVDQKVTLVKQGITDFAKTNDSVVKDAKNKYIKHVEETVNNIVTVAAEDKKNSTEMGLISSQKKLLLDQKEPKTVMSRSNPQTPYTEDYIFATKELTPVAYLSFPYGKLREGAPNFQYPSNHVALMTRYRFASTL